MLKVGDNVKSIHVTFNTGREGKITKIIPEHGDQYMHNHKHYVMECIEIPFDEEWLELLKEETLKVGDKVEIIGESASGYIEEKPAEPKFKKGDRVKIGKNNDNCPMGNATVTKRYDNFTHGEGWYYVKVDGSKGIYENGAWVAREKYITLLKEPAKEVKPETFYCIYVDGTLGYHFKHETLEEAKTEAERLSKQQQNRGRKVHILQEISYCITPETPVEWHETTQGKQKRDSKGKFTK